VPVGLQGDGGDKRRRQPGRASETESPQGERMGLVCLIRHDQVTGPEGSAVYANGSPAKLTSGSQTRPERKEPVSDRDYCTIGSSVLDFRAI
jgi:hypothetical protein